MTDKLDHLERILFKPHTIKEICELLGVERTTVYRMFKRLEEHRGKTLVTYGFRQPRKYILRS